MKYEGNVTIQYREGESRILNVPESRRYPAGELMCQLAQGEALHHFITRARIVPMVIWENNEPLTQKSVDNAIIAVKGFFLDFADEMPVEAYLSASVFVRILEEHRWMVGRDEEYLMQCVVNHAVEYTKDERSEYICGAMLSEFSYEQRIELLLSFMDINTIGGYMMLCFAEYITDIIDGLAFFGATAAVDAGTATEEEKEITERLLNELEASERIHGVEAVIQYDRDSETYDLAYRFSSFLALDVFEYVHMKKTGVKIMKCQNPECGKYFIAQRSTAKYCHYPSPQNPGRSCKQYYPQILYKKNKDTNEGYKLYRRTLSKLMKRRQNHPEEYDHHDAAVVDLTEKYNNRYKLALENGKVTVQEFRSWIGEY